MNELSEYKDLATEKFRREVAEILKLNYAHNNLNLTEYEHRLELSEKAEKKSQLVSLVEDLPAIDDNTISPPTSQSGFTVSTADNQENQPFLCIFSGISKKGVWTPGKNMHMLAVFGGGSLDFTKARLYPGVTNINIIATFGGVTIKIPRGINLEMNGMGIFGGFVSKGGDDEPHPNAPTLRINGLAVFGGVDVTVVDEE